MPTLSSTLDLIRRLHAGQTDKAGMPYWWHPLAVMAFLHPEADIEVRIAALLHDALEDTDTTADDLRAWGYSERVIAAVQAVTKQDDGLSYLDRIRALIASGNRDAMMVKLADNLHNSDMSRLDGCDEATRERMRRMIETRYKPSIELLQAALG